MPESTCPVKWCELADGHESTHQAHIAAVIGEHRGTVALTVESAADNGRNPKAVLSVGNGRVAAVVLSWDALDELANAMLAAHKRHAP